MISFIVIGKNEAKTLAACLRSIEKAISYLPLKEFEIFYIDSASTDNSIDIARSFGQVNIIKITGKCSVAIARNIGYKESNGDILFFFDADMEIFPEFLKNVLDENQNLQYDAVTGQLVNMFHDQHGIIVKEEKESSAAPNQNKIIARGVFLIKRQLFRDCSGFDTRFHNAWEDYDFMIKLRKLGYGLTWLTDYIARHHTISYKNSSKMWQSIWQGKECLRGVLYRDHNNYNPIIKLMLRNEYSLIILQLALFLSIVFGMYYFMLIYILINFIRILIWKPDNFVDFLNKSLALFVRELATLGGFLFYYPMKKELKYEKVRSRNYTN
jgi:glycosyltransferase involved in cell wall biosynthesis